MSENNLGNRVKKIRNDSKINQNDFAKMLAVTQSYISMLENGTRDNIDTKLLITISNKFNVNLNWLLTGEGAPYTESIEQLKEKIKELENTIKKIDLENRKDNKDVASYEAEIAVLNSKLAYANELILKLANR